MICASCGRAEGAGDPCPGCGRPSLLDGRYRLDRLLGRTGGTLTLRATQVGDGRALVLKLLHTREATPALAIHLVDHHARTLEGLRHPGVAVHVDHFQGTFAGRPCVCLVWEQVRGHDLRSEAPLAPPLTGKLLDFLAEGLGLLDLLHGRRIHHFRVSPGNLIRAAEDGHLVLVDFAGPREALDNPVAHSAERSGLPSAPRPGHPPGRQADLQGLARVALFLATGREPPDPVPDPEAWARSHGVELDLQVARILCRMLGRDGSARADELHSAVQEIRWRRKVGRSRSSHPWRQRGPAAGAWVALLGALALWIGADSPALPPPAPAVAIAATGVDLLEAGTRDAATAPDPRERARALAAIARNLARAGRADAIGPALREAEVALRGAWDPEDTRMELLATLAATGDDQAAMEVHRRIATAPGGSARIDAALRAVRAFRDAGLRSEAMGLLEGAAAEAGALRDPVARVARMSGVARLRAALGDAPAARREMLDTLFGAEHGLEESAGGVRALAAAAEALAEAGDAMETDRLATRATELARYVGEQTGGGSFSAEVLTSCARARYRAGDRDGASSLLTEALGAARVETDQAVRAGSLAEIATALAEEGRPDQALLVSRQVPPERREEPALAIVRALLRTGQRPEALEYARSLEATRPDALVEIAASYADAWKELRTRRDEDDYLFRQAQGIALEIDDAARRGRALAEIGLRAVTGPLAWRVEDRAVP